MRVRRSCAKFSADFFYFDKTIGSINKMLFSQRNNLKPLRDKLQIDSLDDETRNRIWSCMCIVYWNKIYSSDGDSYLYEDYYRDQTYYFKKLWLSYFKLPIDTLSGYWSNTYQAIRKYCFECHWYELFDFIEFLINNYDDITKRNEFKKFINNIFEEDFVGYRFVENQITQITTNEEISEIDEAINQPFKAVSTHLVRALELLSDRKNPDYRNSIKESISAVESYSKILTNKNTATLGEAIKEIEKKSSLHPALKESILKLYGYTNDEKGIRHALLEDDKTNFSEAKFMLVSCSSFINYLISKNI